LNKGVRISVFYSVQGKLFHASGRQTENVCLPNWVPFNRQQWIWSMTSTDDVVKSSECEV